MGGCIREENGNPLEKNRENKNSSTIFCCSGLIFLGSDLITSHTGVAADQTQHRAFLLHTLGPLIALGVGPAVHFRNSCALKRIAPRSTTPPPE